MIEVPVTGMLPQKEPRRPEPRPRSLASLEKPESKLLKVIDTNNLLCWSFDSSYDASQLFFSQCEQKAGLGSGRIDLLPPTGGRPSLAFNSTKLAITDVRTFEYGHAHKLLLSVHNTYPGIGMDESNDGLWLVNADGSQLTRLTHSSALQLNRYSQYPWANVSRDGLYFSVATFSSDKTISYGDITGGAPFATVASVGNTVDDVEIIGWTTF